MSFLIESIERATLAAVPPEVLESMPGWLLPLDSGTVGRAHSAVPLTHEAPDPKLIPEIEARYRAQGLEPVFRLPVEQAAFAAFWDALRERGYTPTQATLVMQGRTARMAESGDAQGLDLRDQPHPDWARLYLGEGFDPVDGAHRVRLLERAHDALYVSRRLPEGDANAGAVVAVGCVAFAEGWAGVHGMRTRPMYRGRGYGRAVLSAMGQAALSRGIEQAFLQVEIENQLARALYTRVGFEPLWTYAYWRRPLGRAVDRP